MSEPAASPGDRSLYAAVAGVLLLAVILAAMLVLPRSSRAGPLEPAGRFLGLDEPVHGPLPR
jgi:hypothetical protein